MYACLCQHLTSRITRSHRAPVSACVSFHEVWDASDFCVPPISASRARMPSAQEHAKWAAPYSVHARHVAGYEMRLTSAFLQSAHHDRARAWHAALLGTLAPHSVHACRVMGFIDISSSYLPPWAYLLLPASRQGIDRRASRACMPLAQEEAKRAARDAAREAAASAAAMGPTAAELRVWRLFKCLSEVACLICRLMHVLREALCCSAARAEYRKGGQVLCSTFCST